MAASFTKGGALRDNFFSKNQYLRSTRGTKFESATFSSLACPTELIDGVAKKFVQSGEVIAKITAGPEAGKVGSFQAAGTQETQTLTKSGTVSGGYVVLTQAGVTGDSGHLAFDANAATLQAALDAWLGSGVVTVAGGPYGTTAVTFHFNDYPAGVNEAALVVDSHVTGGGTVAMSESTPGVAGATDGRGITDNILGVLDTFMPWELNERDQNVAYLYDGAVVQGWCFERNAAGLRIPLTNATRDAMLANPALSILFR